MTEKHLFDVIVVATMSAGKSTLINALIGHELLHAANEATTATITRIQDKDDVKDFIGTCYDYNGKAIERDRVVNPDLLKEWNADHKIKNIDLYGDIKGLYNSQSEIVIYDTPGPNNSQDDNHEKLTMEVIDDGNYGLILYILNATQLGINDDLHLLTKIRASLDKDPKKEIIFVLNKIDQIDEEYESIPSVLENTKKYLEKNGFKEPVILPASAEAALLVRKAIYNLPFTRIERMTLRNYHNYYYDNDINISNSSLSKKDKINVYTYLNGFNNPRKITVKDQIYTSAELHRIYVYSGIGVLSYLIQKKLDKKVIPANPKKLENKQVSSSSKKLNAKLTKKSENKLAGVKVKVNISHNPFTVETQFLSGGKEIQSKAFSEYSSQRFQQWVERLFDELHDHFYGADAFSVKFHGLESDFLDLEAAAIEAEASKGMKIDLSFEKAEDATKRLANIQRLVEEAENHPLFKEKMAKNPKILENLEASFNKEFDIYVAATMSSGKSTLINAMLGADLLPAANEATTATIAKIYDTDMPIGEFRGQRFNFEGECVNPAQAVDLEVLQDWNKREDTLLIEIEGNVSGMAKRDEVRLVLSDTPGPNNSQTDEHQKATMGHMKDTKKNPLILYILNATQLGINDDKNTLQMISDIVKSGGKQSKDRFIFVVNKMDMFDPEEDDISNVLQNVKKYLEANGIENPTIYPISANLTRLLRKRASKPDSLSRSERNALNWMEDLFNAEPSMDMLQYMNLTKTVKDKLAQSQYSLVEKRSGLPAIEKVIDTYIEKYNLPERVFRAYRALDQAIVECGNQAELMISLEMNKQEKEKLQSKIHQIERVQADSSKTQAYIQKLKKVGIPLPDKIIDDLTKSEIEVGKKLREISESFIGSVEPLDAQRKLNWVKEDVKFVYQNIANTYESILKQVDELMKSIFEKEYKKSVKAIFNDANEFQMPQLKHTRLQIENVLIQDLDDEEIDVEQVYSHTANVKTGTKRVKVGKTSTSRGFYNPFSWGSTEDIYEDRDVYEEKAIMKDVRKVNLAKLWEKRGKEVSIKFNKLISTLVQGVEEHQKRLVDEYIAFMENEFNPKVNALIQDLKTKLNQQETLKAEIAQAKRALDEIQAFKAKVEHVIHI